MLASKALKEIVTQLEPIGFVLTHHTLLVNKKHFVFVSTNCDIIKKDKKQYN